MVVVDGYSNLPIRPTDNGLKDCDIESPQHARPLTDDEVAALIAEAGERNGNR